MCQEKIWLQLQNLEKVRWEEEEGEKEQKWNRKQECKQCSSLLLCLYNVTDRIYNDQRTHLDDACLTWCWILLKKSVEYCFRNPRLIFLANASGGSFLRVLRGMSSMWCRLLLIHHACPHPSHPTLSSAFVSKGYPPSSSLTLSRPVLFFLFQSLPFSPFIRCSRLSCKSSSLFMINHKFLKYVKN